MRTEARLKQWEAEHGFPGIYSITGRDINRRCGCGKRTKTLSSPFCQTCNTRARDLLAADGQGEVQEPKPKEPRPPKADPGKYTRCKVPECTRIAKHQGRLCPQCYVAANPIANACPSCKKAPRSRVRNTGVCAACQRNIERAAARLWHHAGGNMALACTALAQQGMETDEQQANQLLEALNADRLSSEDMEGAMFGLF